MDLSNKILIIIIILIFTYILMRLFQRRAILQTNYDINIIENRIEGYENQIVTGLTDANTCPINIQDNLQQRLDNINTITGTNPTKSKQLCNYAIKASMNSAFNGTECTTDMINYVLTRGCRFLDLAVFQDPLSSSIIVSVSTGSDFTYPINQAEPLFLSDALNYISMYGFNSTCPSPTDPLFIQFRPRPPKTDSDNIILKSIYGEISNGCNTYLSTFMIPQIGGKAVQVKPTTDISTLLGKCIIVMDNTLYQYWTIDSSNTTNIANIVNMNNNISDSSGGTDTFSYGNLPTQKPLTLSPDKFNCAVNNTITQSLWIDDKNKDYNSNANSYLLFQNYSCQIVPMQFWNNGTDLYNYEMLFNNCGGAIVPLSLVYSKVSVSTNPYIAYPTPIFTMPIYGNQTTSIIVIVGCLGIAGFIVYREFY